MSGLGKCHCGTDSGVSYPLLPGSPSYCSAHDPNPGIPGPDFDDPSFFLPDIFTIPRNGNDVALWTTKEGEDIPITKLKNTHLLNCLKMVQRGLKKDKPDIVIAFLEEWEIELTAEANRRGLQEYLNQGEDNG